MESNSDFDSSFTEFPRLSPEDKSNFGFAGLSKFFTFTRASASPESEGPSEPREASPPWQPDELSDSWPAENFPDSGGEGRSLQNVLKRIRNLVDLKNVGLTSYKNSEMKKYWMKDSSSNECYDCSEKFTTFRRRHHCRVCGQIFCSRCCNQQIPGKIMGGTGDLRVCTYCCKVVLSYLESTDMSADLSADLRALQEDLQIRLVSQQPSVEHGIKRKTSVGYQEDRFALGKVPTGVVLSEEERCRALQNSASLRGLFEEIAKPGTGVELQQYRYRIRAIAGCLSGCDLVDWLISHSKAATRVQAMAIGQMLLEAGYLEALIELSFTDGAAFYRLVTELSTPSRHSELDWGQQEPLPNLATPTADSSGSERFSEGDEEGGLPHSGSSYLLNMNVEDRVVHVAREQQDQKAVRRKKVSVAQEIDPEDSVFLDALNQGGAQDTVVKDGWRDSTDLVPIHGEADAYHRLSASFETHQAGLLSQLLNNVGLSQAWSEIVLPLAKSVADKIRPDIRMDDEMDIRQYVQIKKLPGGNRQDCRILPGIVCTKNVVHKSMRMSIQEPRILILRCAVVYQRIEGRMLSLEPVMMQEHEYLENVVARISFLRPDIVLVHRNVARLAQEELLKRDITLVVNVKISTLDRIARFTNASMISSVDSQIGKPQLGSCKAFYLKTFNTTSDGAKTLMFFEGSSNPTLGCTILLRGASLSELIRLKIIVAFLLFSEYNWRLEKSFLMDEFARPPTPPSELFEDSPIDSPGAKQDKFETADGSSTEPVLKEAVKPRLEEKSSTCLVEDRKLTVEPVSDQSDPLQAVWSTVSATAPLPVAELPRGNKFRMALNGTILSISPFLKVSLPYLESEPGKSCYLRAFFPQDLYYSKLFLERSGEREARTASSAFIKGPSTTLNPKHSFLTSKFVDDASSAHVQTLLALYRANGGQIPIGAKTEPRKETHKADIYKPVDVLDPLHHQRFSVLFCSYSTASENAPAFCVDPWIVKMYFYGSDDIPLGPFLEKFCFRPSYSCLSLTCHVPMYQHVRRFVHDPGTICLTLYKLQKPLPPNRLWMWNWCTQCKETSPRVPMSEDTWNLSFAKYLELRFRGDLYIRRGTTTCRHNLHHEHYQYFAKDNLVASFRFIPIRIRWEIHLPPRLISMVFHSRVPLTAVEELKGLAIKGHEVYSAVVEQLVNMECTEDELQTLKTQQQKDQALFKTKIEEIQTRITSPTVESRRFENTISGNGDSEMETAIWRIEDSIVGLKRMVCESVVQWNSRLHDTKKKRNSEGNLKLQISPPQSDDGRSKEEDEVNSTIDKDEPPGWSTSCDSLNVPESEDNLSVASYMDELRGMEDHTKEKKGVEESQADGKLDKNRVKTILSQILAPAKDSTLIQCPWSPQEHYLLPMGVSINVAVVESEPTSIISYSLASCDYQRHLEEKRTVHSTDASEPTASSPNYKRKTPSTSSSVEKEQQPDPAPSPSHFEMSFEDTAASFMCTMYFPEDFALLRGLVLPAGEEAYLRSLAHCVQWAARGGKSGSSFRKTKDDRFVVKQMSKLELQLFLELAPQYSAYVIRCHEEHRPTLLGKIVGVYTVSCRTSSGGGYKYNLLAMENLFYHRSVTHKYDLKGSVRNRLVNPAGLVDPDIVYLDENLLKMTCDSPLYILPHSQAVLMRAIENDTEFLAAQDVMDYSLLVGLEEGTSELVIGIIDYIRTFTWDKKIENMVKKSVSMGHPSKQPTIVQPKDYRERFIAAMKRYFLPVPDRWYGFGEPCMF